MIGESRDSRMLSMRGIIIKAIVCFLTIRCSFTFDVENFPDPKKYLAQIKEVFNVKVCVWINPYISE